MRARSVQQCSVQARSLQSRWNEERPSVQPNLHRARRLREHEVMDAMLPMTVVTCAEQVAAAMHRACWVQQRWVRACWVQQRSAQARSVQQCSVQACSVQSRWNEERPSVQPNMHRARRLREQKEMDAIPLRPCAEQVAAAMHRQLTTVHTRASQPHSAQQPARHKRAARCLGAQQGCRLVPMVASAKAGALHSVHGPKHARCSGLRYCCRPRCHQ